MPSNNGYLPYYYNGCVDIEEVGWLALIPVRDSPQPNIDWI